MSDTLIEIGEEMERRYPEHDIFYWMNWVMDNPKNVPEDIKEEFGRSLFEDPFYFNFFVNVGEEEEED